MSFTRSLARSFALTATALLCVLLVGGPPEDAAAQPKPEGEMRWALYVTLSPMWFDPAEIGGLTPFWVLYAIHDAVVKPMPGNLLTPSLAESWTVSADLPSDQGVEGPPRQGPGGDDRRSLPGALSFARAVARLHDLLRHAGERVGDDGFKKHPIGLGPYKFVSHTPGIELVMEAFEGYWRKVPSVKRLVFKSVPDSITRAAMLKRGEVDVAYLLDVPQALEVKKDPTLQQILHDRVRFAPIWEYVWPSGIGPRVEEPALMLINPYPWSVPLEEVRLKKK